MAGFGRRLRVVNAPLNHHSGRAKVTAAERDRNQVTIQLWTGKM